MGMGNTYGPHYINVISGPYVLSLIGRRRGSALIQRRSFHIGRLVWQNFKPSCSFLKSTAVNTGGKSTGVNDIGRGELGERYLPKSASCWCQASIMGVSLSVSDHHRTDTTLCKRWCDMIPDGFWFAVVIFCPVDCWPVRGQWNYNFNKHNKSWLWRRKR